MCSSQSMCDLRGSNACPKTRGHCQFQPVEGLTVDKLPPPWGNPEILSQLEGIQLRVVQLIVLKSSPSRQGTGRTGDNLSNVPRHGTGFITFNNEYGPLVHTSNHVVKDEYEARHTVIRVFYLNDSDIEIHFSTMREIIQSLEKPPGTLLEIIESKNHGYLFASDREYFKTSIFTDYTVFSGHKRMKEAYPKANHDIPAFDYRQAAHKSLVMSDDLDIAIISHPHGMKKSISFGTTDHMTCLLPALYDAQTRKGTSGAPICRLHKVQGKHFVSSGLFIHHASLHSQGLSTGTVRPPTILQFPRKPNASNVAGWVWQGFGLAEDFLLYWVLVIHSHPELVQLINESMHVVAFFLPPLALVVSVNATIDQVLWTSYWTHITLSTLTSLVQGPRVTSVVHASLSAAFSVLSFMIGWGLLIWTPDSIYLRYILVTVAWPIFRYMDRWTDTRGKLFTWLYNNFPARKSAPSGAQSDQHRIQHVAVTTPRIWEVLDYLRVYGRKLLNTVMTILCVVTIVYSSWMFLWASTTVFIFSLSLCGDPSKMPLIGNAAYCTVFVPDLFKPFFSRFKPYLPAATILVIWVGLFIDPPSPNLVGIYLLVRILLSCLGRLGL